MSRSAPHRIDFDKILVVVIRVERAAGILIPNDSPRTSVWSTRGINRVLAVITIGQSSFTISDDIWTGTS